MDADFRRPESHETDSEARRLVAAAIPPQWEHRELSGRDYGLDMQVEVFSEGRPTGGLLLLQIKGTQATAPPEDQSLAYDVPVRMVRYARLFAVPVMLVVCHVRATPATCHFLWIQEYVRVVLSNENREWEQNRSTVRVKIPCSNQLPGCEGRLRFAAGYPERLRCMGQLARIQHELSSGGATPADSIGLLEEALAQPAIVEDADWSWGREVLRPRLEHGLQAARSLAQRKGSAEEEWELESRIRSAAAMMSAAVAVFNDHRLSYATWMTHGDHSF
jgi:hypothetical protein